MRSGVVCLLLFAVSACAPGLPDPDSRLSAEARAADYPDLVPLGPLLAGVDAPRPTGTAAAEGRTLEARADDLRRRAAWLRSLSL